MLSTPLIYDELGSSGYTAPEVISGQGYNQKADIWSFAIVLWELTSPSSRFPLNNPLAGIYGDEFVAAAQRDGCRPLIDLSQEWCRQLLENCWASDPMIRPSATKIVQQLPHLVFE